ncbi:uncharacterized protein LOC117123506 [Anneissia japonica]|uniref:uncharacterized protein LOC117123506 n=1 Tax=Anneissia japonica TaxID=1529436 RepID=UPI0014255912|nr:uncharacterized protein LOC117123506 [Anneissia japonica]
MKMNPTSADAKKYTEVIQEYQAVYRELVRKRLALPDDSDLSDQEMSEKDLLQMTNSYEYLAQLSKTLSVMETPVLRKLFGCTDSTSGTYPSCEARGRRPDGSTVTHIVCNKLKAFMVQNLASDTEVMHHKSLDDALQITFDGDDVLLYPSTYSSWRLGNMQQSITIKGVGEQGDVIIDTDDIPVEISSYEFVIDNVMFTCDSHSSSDPVLRVKRGNCEVRKCMFQGGSVGILAHGQCSLVVRNCSIQGASKAGLVINQGCSVTLTDNSIVQCGSCQPRGGVVCGKDTGAVLIYMDDVNDEKTKLTLKNNKLIENYSFDICLVASDVKDNTKIMTSNEFLNHPMMHVELKEDNELKIQTIAVVGS